MIPSPFHEVVQVSINRIILYENEIYPLKSERQFASNFSSGTYRIYKRRSYFEARRALAKGVCYFLLTIHRTFFSLLKVPIFHRREG